MKAIKNDVVFATPTLGHHVCVEFLASALSTDRMCIANNITPAWVQLGGDPYLSKVRCKLMTKFLEDFPEAHSFFFLDDDIGWPAHKAVEFICNPTPVMAGIYPKKMDDVDFPVILAGDPETGKAYTEQGFYMAREVPTGFLRIKREVMEALATSSDKFVDLIGGKRVEFYEMCKMGTDAKDANGWWTGEDYDLSRRITALGYQLWVDPDIEFTHRGTKAWRRKLSDFVEKFGPAKEAQS